MEDRVKNSQQFMRCMSQAHRWELGSHPIFGTFVGRHVYMCIIGELCDKPYSEIRKSLKQIFSHTSITDRAIRLKLRDLEREGYIEIDYSETDGRHRNLMITEKMESLIKTHEDQLLKIFKKEFIILENKNHS